MFSVVIPVYNHGRYVEAAVRSAVNSSLVAEVLLVDDGSSDGSADVIDQVTRAHAPLLRNLTAIGKSNFGAHHRLNELCHQAKSEWIAVLNSDDEFTAGRFEILRMLIRGTRSGFLCGALLVMDNNGRVTGTKRGISEPEYELPHKLVVPSQLSTRDIRRILLNQNFVATTSNMVFRKDLFRRIGGFANFRYVHDWDFALRATMVARCTYTPNFLSKYRVHSANTIREDSSHMDGEVVRMLTRFLEEFPEVEEESICRLSLSGNRHLGRYVPPERLGQPHQSPVSRLPLIGLLERADAGQFARVTLPKCVRLVSGPVAAELWGTADYLHAPIGTLRLSQRVIDNVALCLAHFDYDFIIVSETLDELPTVHTASLRDAAIFNARAADLFMGGETPKEPLTGRVMRLPPAVDEFAQDWDLRSLPGFADVRILGAEVLVSGALRGPTIRVPIALPDSEQTARSSGSGKPRVIVLPMFLAVGGAERNMIEVIRALFGRYEFLVVTTERLAKHQGSLHHQLEALGVRTLDLAEICDREHHVAILETISHEFPPDVVWICNGSPWLADNSEKLRRIFSHAPVVDQQVYDTDHGWISRYSDRGIQSFDRFIAINQKIRDKFLDQIAIPAHRVDLIYHAVNSEKLRAARKELEISDALRQKYAIPKDRYCFGFIGRLTEQKRPLDYLALAKEAQDRGLDDHFLLVGSGGLEAKCDDFIAEHNLLNVTSVRFCDPITPLMNMLDGLIITSIYEGLPIVLLEALSLGTPVLSTDVGDIKLVLSEYNSGKIVGAGGDFNALWTAYAEWRTNLDQFRKCAEAHAEAVLARFSSETIGNQYDSSWRAGMEEYVAVKARACARMR